MLSLENVILYMLGSLVGIGVPVIMSGHPQLAHHTAIGVVACWLLWKIHSDKNGGESMVSKTVS